MAWTLNGKRIFVQEYGGTGVAIIPRIQPLTGGTVYQYFGHETEIIPVSCIIVGNQDMNNIKGLVKTKTAVSLVGPYSINKNVFVKKVSYKLLQTNCQTLRQDLSKTAPVYSVELELYLDE